MSTDNIIEHCIQSAVAASALDIDAITSQLKPSQVPPAKPVANQPETRAEEVQDQSVVDELTQRMPGMTIDETNGGTGIGDGGVHVDDATIGGTTPMEVDKSPNTVSVPPVEMKHQQASTHAPMDTDDAAAHLDPMDDEPDDHHHQVSEQHTHGTFVDPVNEGDAGAAEQDEESVQPGEKSAKDHVSSKWGLDVSLGKTAPVTTAIDAETNVIEERVAAPVSVVDETSIAPAQPQEEAEKAEKSETTADDTTVAARSTRTEAPMCAKKVTSGTNIESSNAKDLPPTSEAERGKVTQTALETDPDSQEKERVPAPPPREDVIIAAHDTKTTAIVEQSTHSLVADAAAAAAHLESTNITPGVDIDDDQPPRHDAKDEVSTHAIIETDQKVENGADEPRNEPPAVEQHESPATPLPERLETARTVEKAVNDAAADPPPALASEKDQKKLPLPPASLTNGSNGHHGHAPSKIAAQQIHATQTPANKALPKAATANKAHAKKDKCVMM